MLPVTWEVQDLPFVARSVLCTQDNFEGLLGLVEFLLGTSVQIRFQQVSIVLHSQERWSGCSKSQHLLEPPSFAYFWRSAPYYTWEVVMMARHMSNCQRYSIFTMLVLDVDSDLQNARCSPFSTAFLILSTTQHKFSYRLFGHANGLYNSAQILIWTLWSW